MKIAVLGTGMVGQTIASKLVSLGHEIILGTRNVKETSSRETPNQMTGISFVDWYKKHPEIKLKDFSDLPADCFLYINATSGSASVSALKSVGESNLNSKTIIDIANPLDFSRGMPPSLSVCNTDSLAEQIQREFPTSRVVKTLNTMNCSLMVNPSLVSGDHNVFISGNDADAKKTVQTLLLQFGWKESNIIDLGNITTARGTEMILPMWLNLMGTFGNPNFNFSIVQN